MNHSLPIMCSGPDGSLGGGAGGSDRTLSALPPLPLKFNFQACACLSSPHTAKLQGI